MPSSNQPDERTPLLDREAANPEPPSVGDEVKPAPPEVSQLDFLWILFGSLCPVFLSALDGTIVATLLSPIGSHFNKSNQASYLGTSYLLSVAACTPLYGRLSDLLGRRGAMLLALVLFTAGTVLCAASTSMGFLIAARAVSGMGGGGVLTVSAIIVTDLVPLRQRGLYTGLGNIVFGLGSGLGGPIGGWISDTYGWRLAFSGQIPIMIISIILVSWKVNIPLPPSLHKLSLMDRIRRIDFIGAFSLVTAVGCLLLPISLKNTEDLPWSHPIVWGLLIVSGVSFIVFGIAETRWSSHPVLPFRIIKRRTPFFISWTCFSVIAVAYSYIYNVPLYFSAVRLTSAKDSGAHLFPNSIAVGVGSVFAGWMMRRTGKYWWLCMITSVLPIISSIRMALWSDKSSAFALWFDIIPNGFGISCVLTVTLIAMIASSDKEDIAVATAITYLFRSVGQVLGVSLSGALVQGILLQQLEHRITGPGSAEIIEKIRHATSIIPTLEPELQQIAVDSYQIALRLVFIIQAVVSAIAVLTCFPIQEFTLDGTLKENPPPRTNENGEGAPNSGAST